MNRNLAERDFLPKNPVSFFTLFFFVCALFISTASAQLVAPSPTPVAAPTPVVSKTPSLERKFFSNILKDQYAIWTSPFHLQRKDARWIAPLGAASAVLFATDKRTAAALDNNSSRLRVSRDISRFGDGFIISGATAAIYLAGRSTHNQRLRETGLLAAEALINNAIVTSAIKAVTQRPRPLEKDGSGKFFSGGNSFVSGHSSTIWTFATVISDEYGQHRPWMKFGMFGLATAVSLSRFTGRKHFLSDILLGSALGYGIGHFTYLKHHDTILDTANGTKKTTKLEKYFPIISPDYNAHDRVYGINLTWNL